MIYIVGKLWILALICHRAIEIWRILLAVRFLGTRPDCFVRMIRFFVLPFPNIFRLSVQFQRRAVCLKCETKTLKNPTESNSELAANLKWELLVSSLPTHHSLSFSLSAKLFVFSKASNKLYVKSKCAIVPHGFFFFSESAKVYWQHLVSHSLFPSKTKIGFSQTFYYDKYLSGFLPLQIIEHFCKSLSR